MCFPSFPRFCGQTFMEAAGQGTVRPVRQGVQRLDGRGVVRRLERPPHPADHHPALGRRAGRRRGPPQRRAGRARPCASARSRRTSGCRRSTPTTGSRSSGPAPRRAPSSTCTSGRSSKMPSTSADAPAAVGSTLTFGNAMSSMTDWLYSGWLARFPTLKLAYSEGQIGWIPYILERADKVWEDNRAWGGFGDKVPEPPSHLLLPPDLRLLLRRRVRPGQPDARSASTTSASRPTTRTPTSTWPHSPRDRPQAHGAPARPTSCASSCAATPSRCSTSTSTDSARPSLRGVQPAVSRRRVRRRRR